MCIPTQDHREEDLRLYAILRGDLIMSEGKSNAQAGHAYVDGLIASAFSHDRNYRATAKAYARLRPGTKICLDGGDLSSFEKICARLNAENIPHALITDRDHIELPHFDGSPIVTAIGLGPFHKSTVPRFLRKLPMWKGGARLIAGTDPP